MKYSICITHLNNAGTVKSSLDSILSQVDDRFEIVVVDGVSKDGSWEILQQYSRAGKIRLFQKKCSRGIGRQVAFENSLGDYVIANLDMDDVFKPSLGKLLQLYHSRCDGKLLVALGAPPAEHVWLPNVTVGSRELISRLGGWRDLQIAEDWDLWCRASKEGEFRTVLFPLTMEVGEKSRGTGGVMGFKRRYASYRDYIKLGRTVFSPGERISFSQRVAQVVARLSVWLGGSYFDEYNRTFDPYNPTYYLGDESNSFHLSLDDALAN